MLKIVQARVDRLRVNPRNPRTIRPERLAQLGRTMEAERGLLELRPVIAGPDGVVIAGNQRLQAARLLNWETIPAVFVEVDEEQATRWMFLDNRGFGEDDEDLVAELLFELDERGADLDLTGYDRPETEALLRRLAYREKHPDALPEPEDVVADSAPGTVYELGRHRLMCGDATDPAHVAELLGGAEPMLLATDAPYGVALDNRWREKAGLNRSRRRGREHATTTLASDERADWSAAYELVSSANVGYFWHASRYGSVVQAGLERIGFEVRQQIIWNKGSFALSRQLYHWAHEPCWFAVRPGTRVPWYGPRNQSTVWEAASPKMVATGSARARADEKVDHPTQKPVALFTRPIENHLEPGGLVYDPFAGSGTAVIAAELTGRTAYLMELDPRCVDVIRARYRAFTDGQ
jgi:DNA modification methylase